MQCPHCLMHFHSYYDASNDVVHKPVAGFSWYDSDAGITLMKEYIGDRDGTGPPTALWHDIDGYWWIRADECSACKRIILWSINFQDSVMSLHSLSTDFSLSRFGSELAEGVHRQLLYPRKATFNRKPAPPEVLVDVAQDYEEACLTLNDSPRASAMLSRRCVQNILRNTAGVRPGRLVDEIKEATENPAMPSELADAMQNIRHVGNTGAHPNTYKGTAEIIEVEPDEADALLDIIEELFDFYYVRPAKSKAFGEKVNLKHSARINPTKE